MKIKSSFSTESATVKNNTSTQGAATTAPHPLALRRRIPSPPTRSTHMTRSHATSTTSTQQEPAMAVHDHNYLASESAAASRAPRRILSRHQRNADELDTSLDPLSSSRIMSLMTNTRRPTSTTANNITTRRLRGHTSQEDSQGEEPPEDEEAVASDEGTDGGSSSEVSNDNDDDEEATATDSEDNQPLTSYVSPSNGQTRRKSKTSSRSATTVTRQRRRGRITSDNSFNNEDDDDDYEAPRGRLRSNQRSGRNQKRPRYNEQSDEEDQQQNPSHRKRMRNGDVHPETNNSNGSQEHVDGPQRPAMPRADDEGGSSTVESDEQLVSVSSRGRVRKISAKARGIFKD